MAANLGVFDTFPCQVKTTPCLSPRILFYFCNITLTRLGLQCRTPLRGKGQIGFGQVFFEFWSGFSLDFTLFGLEIKVGVLEW